MTLRRKCSRQEKKAETISEKIYKYKLLVSRVVSEMQIKTVSYHFTHGIGTS